MPGGGYHTKYESLIHSVDDGLYGLYSENHGISVIKGGKDYIEAGPFKQSLTVHQEYYNPVLLWMNQSGHMGNGILDNLQVGWEKMYGPVAFYVGGGDSFGEIWEDAKAQLEIEKALWPYSWMTDELYAADQRGTVTGKIDVTDGTSPKDALVILAQPGSNWQRQNDGYISYVRADAQGNFTLPNVRPGSYSMYVIVTGAMGQTEYKNITVTSNATNDLGIVELTPRTYGEMLWQIGTPDWSAAEFKYGDQFRTFGNFMQYNIDFPDGVNFTIGESDEAVDFNYLQPSMKVPGADTVLEAFGIARNTDLTEWKINFSSEKELAGTATLSIGIAGSDSEVLKVSINGTEIGRWHFSEFPDKYDTDTTNYEGIMQNPAIQGLYKELNFSFDASLIQPGTNTITLAPYENVFLLGNAPYSAYAGIMYDFIRLEVDAPEPDDCGTLGCDWVPVSAVPSSTNLQNNTRVTITINGRCNRCGDTAVLASAQVNLKQNGKQTVTIGGYTVTVSVNDNNKITSVVIKAPPVLT